MINGCFPFQEKDALQNVHFETEGNFQYKSGNYLKSVVQIIMPPFEKGGAYCVAPVGMSVCR